MAKKRNKTGRTGWLTWWMAQPLPVRALQIVLAVYFFLLLVVHPLCFDNYYGNLGTYKWIFFSGISFGYTQDSGIPLLPGGLLLALLCWIWYLIDCRVHGRFRETLHPKKLTVTDGVVLAFLASTLLSALLAPDRLLVVSGFPGWYMGLLAQLAFIWIYFLVSRFLCEEKIRFCLLAAMTGAGVFVGGMGILNRFGIDALRMHVLTSPDMAKGLAQTAYLSTMGNRGWYATYLCVILPIALWVFQYAENKWLRVFFVSFFCLRFAGSCSFGGFWKCFCCCFSRCVCRALCGRYRARCRFLRALCGCSLSRRFSGS